MNKLLKKFPRTFWVANGIELFERWAWYGFFMLFANYLTASTELGALGLSQTEKGMIMGVGTAILYFLPLITGALADRYGYRRMLFIAFIVYASAFALFPLASGFWAVFLMYLYLALGAALFKPIISATVAKTTTSETSSIGFGIFYMMVNLGAFIGPLVTLVLQKKDYDYVFYASAIVISINFFMLLLFKEPEREESNLSLGASLKKVFQNIGIALSDVKLVVFLLLVSGFWTMYNQLFFTLPVFVTQWVDTSSVYNFFASMGNFGKFITDNYAVSNGVMDAEFIVNFDAMFIIIFQIMVSALVMKRKPLSAMMGGFVVCAIGMALTLFTQNVLFTIAAILIFALGEMASSPKITEYIGRIAPKDKIALYMGCSFLPVFLGNFFAGFIAGNAYSVMSDRETLALRAVEEAGVSTSGMSAGNYFEQGAQALDMTAAQFKTFLWDTYNPSKIWILILAIGMVAVIGLYLYDKLLLNKKNN